MPSGRKSDDFRYSRLFIYGHSLPSSSSDCIARADRGRESLPPCAGYLSFITEEDKAALKTLNEERATKGLPQVEADINYIRDGYDYRKGGGERFVGLASRVFITFEQTDVTDRMTSGLSDIEDPLERYEELERREKTILKEAESDPDIRAEVRRFFRGEQYILIRKRQLKDLRLVYAPPKSVGYFGGDERNWEFPRHVGDFALLRIYTGPDGESADHAKENRPYEPGNTIRIAQGDRGLAIDDLIFVGALNGENGFAGLIDEVQVYNRALSDTEVAFLQANPGEEIGGGPVEPSDLRILSISRSQDSITLQWLSAAGNSYVVEYSPDLELAGWSAVATVAATGAISELNDMDAGRNAAGSGYYRVREE